MNEDLDNTQQLVSALPQENQLRRKDDLKRLAFRQHTAYYSILLLFLIVAAILYRDSDIGTNQMYVLMLIAAGNVANIAHVIGAKWHEKVAALRGGDQ